MSGLFGELRRRQPALAAGAAAMLAILAASLLAMAFETRSINGVSVWTKPAKFAASLALWLGCLAWAFGLLRPAARRGAIAWLVVAGTLGAAALEILWIVFRAAGAEPSHFATDPLGAFMYGVMGLGALTLVVLAALLGLLILLRGDAAAPARMRFAWAIGLVLSGVLGGVTGFAISANGGPYLGGTPNDSNAIAPFFWSRDGGDLRVAHFLAVHAMQAVPLLAWAVRGLRAAAAWGALAAGSTGYAAATLAAFALARGGVALGL